MTYRELVERERKQYIGRTAFYKGEEFKIVDVDYNGAIMINKKARFTDTTAVSRFDENLEII